MGPRRCALLHYKHGQNHKGKNRFILAVEVALIAFKAGKSLTHARDEDANC
jgi:hypothetical protein